MAGWYNKVRKRNSDVVKIPNASVRWIEETWGAPSSFDPITRNPIFDAKDKQETRSVLHSKVTVEYNPSQASIIITDNSGNEFSKNLSSTKGLEIKLPERVEFQPPLDAINEYRALQERMQEEEVMPKQQELGLEMPEQPVVPHQYWGRGIRV